VNAGVNWRLEDPACTVASKSETEVKEPGSEGRKNVGHGLKGIQTPRWAGAGSGRQCKQQKRSAFVHSWFESRRDGQSQAISKRPSSIKIGSEGDSSEPA